MDGLKQSLDLKQVPKYHSKTKERGLPRSYVVTTIDSEDGDSPFYGGNRANNIAECFVIEKNEFDSSDSGN
jgi:hypothetical protein